MKRLLFLAVLIASVRCMNGAASHEAEGLKKLNKELLVASRAGDLPRVKLLVEQGANP